MAHRICGDETQKQIIFCFHSKEKDNSPIKLVVTVDKSDDGEQNTFNVDYCPFCGFNTFENIK